MCCDGYPERWSNTGSETSAAHEIVLEAVSSAPGAARIDAARFDLQDDRYCLESLRRAACIVSECPFSVKHVGVVVYKDTLRRWSRVCSYQRTRQLQRGVVLRLYRKLIPPVRTAS